MFLKTLKYLQLLSGLVLTGLFLAAPTLMPALYPHVTPVTSAANLYTQDPALLILLAAAAANLMAGCYQLTLPGARRPLQSLASIALFLAGIVAAANALARLYVDPVTAMAPLAAVSLLVSALVLHTLCNLHRLSPAAASSTGQSYDDEPMTTDSGRESGTVKWFNVSKGFGFITRDSGEDIFVHYRAIRGEGHRTLSEGQRVHFIVTEKEKGLQAEDVSSARG